MNSHFRPAVKPANANLSGLGLQTLSQLFFAGPLRAENLCSTPGRDELGRNGYADVDRGFWYLTPAGVAAALDLELGTVKEHWIDRRETGADRD